MSKALDNKVTVVVLNWLRSKQLRHIILPAISSYPIVKQVLVSHGRSDTFFETPELIKVVHYNHIELNKSHGLSLRFLLALESTTQCVLFVDDDILPSEESIETLYIEWKKNVDSIHGLKPRWFFRFRSQYYYTFLGSEFLYLLAKLQGRRTVSCDMVLTSCAMTSKAVSKQALKYSQELLDWAKLNTKPLWNGEDILLSFCSLKLSSSRPQAHLLSKKQFADSNSKVAISSLTGHFKTRTTVINKLHTHLRLI